MVTNVQNFYCVQTRKLYIFLMSEIFLSWNKNYVANSVFLPIVVHSELNYFVESWNRSDNRFKYFIFIIFFCSLSKYVLLPRKGPDRAKKLQIERVLKDASTNCTQIFKMSYLSGCLWLLIHFSVCLIIY